MLFATIADLPDDVRGVIGALSLQAQGLFLAHANAVGDAGGSEEAAVAVGLRGLRKAKFVEARKKAAFHEGPVRVLEALNEEGTAWDVVLIEAGRSENGVNYTRELLSDAAKRYENAPAYAFDFTSADGQTYFDHLAEPERFSDKLAEAFVGWYENVRLVGDELRATFRVAADWLRTKFLEAWYAGEELLGFSHDVWAAGDYYEPSVIFKVDSVDVVTNPAAGGRVLRLVAASGPGEGPEPERGGVRMKWDVVRKILEARYKKLIEGIDLDKATDEQKADLTKKLEAELLKAPADPPPADPPPADPPPADPPPADPPPAKSGGDDGAQNLAESKKVLEEARKLTCSIMLENRLKESKLPEPFQVKLRETYKDKVFDEEELTKSIQREKEAIDQLREGGVISGFGPGPTPDTDQVDKWRAAMEAMLGGEEGEHGSFPGIKEAYAAITGTYDRKGEAILFDIAQGEHKKRLESIGQKRLAESISVSTFAELFGDSMRKRLVAEYAMPGLDDWKKLVSTVKPLQDFRSQKIIRYGGYGDLPTVAERGPYLALSTPTDEESTYAPAKRGGTEDLSIEAIRNDDLGAMRRIPQKLGRAAARTLYKFVLDFLRTNPTLDYDSTALFHANHNNLSSTPLSYSALATIRQTMLQQAELDSSEVLMITPKYLWVPAELENTGFQIVTAAIDVSASIRGVPSIHANMELVVVGYWTDATDYCVTCDPSMCPTIEIGFLDGRQDPELFVQDLPNVGSMFASDVVTYKIRHIYGGDVEDHRGMHKAVVAG